MENLTLITTTSCPACGNLINKMIPLCKRYRIKVDHLIAKTVLGKPNEVRLYRDGKFAQHLPDQFPRQFPIVIYGNRYTLIGEDSDRMLKDLLEGDMGITPSVEQKLEEQSNIDYVQIEYEDMERERKMREGII